MPEEPKVRKSSVGRKASVQTSKSGDTAVSEVWEPEKPAGTFHPSLALGILPERDTAGAASTDKRDSATAALPRRGSATFAPERRGSAAAAPQRRGSVGEVLRRKSMRKSVSRERRSTVHAGALSRTSVRKSATAVSVAGESEHWVPPDPTLQRPDTPRDLSKEWATPHFHRFPHAPAKTYLHDEEKEAYLHEVILPRHLLGMVVPWHHRLAPPTPRSRVAQACATRWDDRRGLVYLPQPSAQPEEEDAMPLVRRARRAVKVVGGGSLQEAAGPGCASTQECAATLFMPCMQSGHGT